MNTNDMMEDLRDNIAESTAQHWTNEQLLRRLNNAQRQVAALVYESTGDWLLKSTTLTPSSSVLTLPSDCVRVAYMESATDGYPIPYTGTVRERRLDRVPGTTLNQGTYGAYFVGDTIEINADDFTDNVKIWYQRSVPDLHMGTASAGAATSLTFEDALRVKKVADYYNGVLIDVHTGTGAGQGYEITDFTAALVATTDSGSFDATSEYATISVLPEFTHNLIVLIATLSALAKPSSTFDAEVYKHYGTVTGLEKAGVIDILSQRFDGSLHTRIVEYD